MKGQKLARISFTALRVAIGWHFLYEGIVKVFNPAWSSEAYLRESKWLLSGFFHWIIGNKIILEIVDFINIWGLIIIGICLFLGFFVRIASFSGSLLLLLYYVANPPFMYSSIPSISHFYIINYNIIEAVALIVIAILPLDYLWGLRGCFIRYYEKRKEKTFPTDENHGFVEGDNNSRRELIKNLAVLPVFGAVLFGMMKKRGWISFEEKNFQPATDSTSGASLILGKNLSVKELKGKIPEGIIKNIKFSRLMIGGNLISGFAHARDLIYVSTWLKNYFTDEKVIETLWICEACGINTAVLRCDQDTIRILNKFWSRGGRIQWLAQTYPRDNDFSNIKLAIDNGAIGAFVQGGIADKLVSENKTDQMGRAIDYIRSQNVIAGTAAHSMRVLKSCVENDIRVDFFMKTFHHHNYWSATSFNENETELPSEGKDHNMAHDNIWCLSNTEVMDFFRDNPIPWIAYKVLAAGAIKPKDGIRHAFQGGADFVCLGMFDFQIVEDVNITFDILNSDLKRQRKWFA